MYKKVYVVMLAAVLTASYAQAQISLGARAGFSLTNQSEKYDGKKPNKEERSKMKPGFQIGVTGEYALTDVLSVQSGLLIATQGYRFKYTDDDEDLGYSEEKVRLNITYLQIPIHALYQMDLGDMKLVLQAGPYLGYALGGKTKYEGTYGGRTEKHTSDVEFGSEVGKMKRFELGLGLGAALQFDKLRAGIGYQFGLTNLSNFEKTSQKNNGLTLSLTYMFDSL